MMKHEAIKPKIPEIHFKPEDYTSSSDIEYLNQLMKKIKAKGFDPDQLVFSGFDARPLDDGRPLPRYNAIYAMNQAGWRKALENNDNNPAWYAECFIEGGGVPCIGLYDRHQLIQVYSHGVPGHPENLFPSDREWQGLQYKGQPVLLPDDVLNEGTEPDFTHRPYDEYIGEREEFTDIVPGRPLDSLPPDEPVERGVIHKNYPEGSPTDALVGLVFLDIE